MTDPERQPTAGDIVRLVGKLAGSLLAIIFALIALTVVVIITLAIINH